MCAPWLILLTGFVAASVMISAKSEPPREDRRSESTYVEVVTVRAEEHQSVITAFGTVQAHREFAPRPEVSGLVVDMHNNLIEGGIVGEGELIVQIDPRNYRLAVEKMQAACIAAETALKVEKGRQVVAKQEWALLSDSLQQEPATAALALRMPHLEEREAALFGARSDLARAELDLERTSIHAPFNVLLLSTRVEVGQYVDSQAELATLVSVDSFDILVSVPASLISTIRLPADDGSGGASVRVVQDGGNGEWNWREGRIVRLLGDVDPKGRMARVLVRVEDPLGRGSPRDGKASEIAPLLLGSYVRVEIAGELLPEVFSLPSNSIREGGHVWIRNRRNLLEIREVELVEERHDTVLVRGAVEDGDDVITSVLSSPVPNMALRPKGEAADARLPDAVTTVLSDDPPDGVHEDGR